MKIFLFFLSFLFFPILSFATEYKPIPIEKSNQYKIEIEQIINKEVPKYKKDIDNVVVEAKQLHDKLIKDGYNFEDYHNLLLMSEIVIFGFVEELDTKLITFTQKNYFQNIYKPETIDDFYTYRNYLYRNFKENNINTKKITELLNYQSLKNKTIEKYIKHIQKTILPEE